jgi:hypothetical protein
MKNVRCQDALAEIESARGLVEILSKATINPVENVAAQDYHLTAVLDCITEVLLRAEENLKDDIQAAVS